MLVAIVVISLCIGRYPIGPGTVVAIVAAKAVPVTPWWPRVAEAVVFDVRLPRILAALTLGAALAASGAAYQGVFRNPMASPDILGVAAGAGFGAGLGILASWGPGAVQSSAFVFGLIAAAATSFAGAWRGDAGDGALTMILAGIFVGALFSALLSLLKFLADPANVLPAITFWLMGSLANITTRELTAAGAPIAGGFSLLWALRWRLDVLTFGDEEAQALGVDAARLRLAIVAGATLMTSAAVAIGGIIGLVGLIAPHMARPFSGPSHRGLIPTSACMGGVFLLAVDDLARTCASAELPIGVLTSLVGAPVFLYLLSSIARKGWS